MKRDEETFGERFEGVPNLDAMSKDELMKFWLRYQQYQKRDEAEALLGRKMKNYTLIVANLGAYAANKAAAMACRLEGNITGAEVYEQICEGIYSRLPEEFRW